MKKYFVFLIAAVSMIMAGCEIEETIGGGTEAPNKAPVSGVTLEQTTLVKMVGQWEMLAHNVLPDNAGNKAVTWTSSNAAVVEVNNMGDLIARSIGSATITVTTEEGNFTATCQVTVNPFVGTPVEGVRLDATELDIEMARKIRLTPILEPSNATIRAVKWVSDNESAVTITNGIVEGIAPGTATITVTTADGGFTAECTVTVSEDFLIEDFEGYNVGDEISSYGWDNPAGKVAVALAPQDNQDAPTGIANVGPGKVGFIHGTVVNATYGDMGSTRVAPKFEVKLPEGKKLADYTSVTFDAYVYRGKDTDSQGRDDLGDANSGCGWYGAGTFLRINDVQGGSTNLRVRGALTFPDADPSTQGGEWDTRIWARGIKLNLSELDAEKFADLANLNSFTLVFGTSSGYAVYCVDNVILRK